LTLAVKNLSVSYRGVTAVHDVSLSVEAGQCVAVIGANGAGKTSLLRGISGLVRTPRDSQVFLDGRPLHRVGAAKRARLGLGHVLESRHVFSDLTVEQNLVLGRVAARMRGGGAELADAYKLFPALEAMKDKPASSLSGGQQQFLAIARALMGKPKVVMMDEPSVGLAPVLVDGVIELIQTLTSSGIPVLLSEQELRLVTATADHVHLLAHGKVIGATTGADPQLEQRAHEAYLA
jgi:branched-chain amino acid transport system ATP-binding protein